ncbi:MAG: GNAT family N-acetyltransferase [Christensenellales bacterium]
MTIRIAELKDLHFLTHYDKHIPETQLINEIEQRHILIAETDGKNIGWLRFNYFWDNTPFMNMLFMLSEYRGNKHGTNLIAFWEEQMKLSGFHSVMTSTQSNEYAQHFYYKLGYRAIGGFLRDNEPYELILSKEI